MSKISIRNGVFETNSSSTHSISICSDKDFTDWAKGITYFNCWEKVFVKKEEIIPHIVKASNNYYNSETLSEIKKSKPGEFEELRVDYDFLTYDEYFDDEDLESYREEFTTESGDNIVAFGKFGYDG